MTMRRGGRPPQVRPRPPSGSRSSPKRVRPRAPAGRISPHRKVREARGLPLAAKLVLALAVVALAGAVLYSATGGIGRVVAGVGGIVGDFVERITEAPSPSPTAAVVAGAPSIGRPQEPYTNQDTIDIVVTVPADSVRRAAARVKLYLTLEGQAAAPIAELPIGATSRLVFPQVELTPGPNGFSATIVDAAGESEPSPVVEYILDQDPPMIRIASPKNGATVNHDVAIVKGSTQPRSSLIARNEANGATASTTAGSDGAFELTIPLMAGTNGIQLTATDPAGNTADQVLAVRRGSGKLTVSLTASAYRFKIASLPDPLELRVVVTDPDGSPLEGAEVTFTLQVLGLQPFVSTVRTGGNGTATFSTTIPKGAQKGGGLAAVLVDAGELGTVSDRTVITIE